MDLEGNQEDGNTLEVIEVIEVKTTMSAVPYSEIFTLYQQHCPDLQKVSKLNEKRKTRIRVIWKEQAEHRSLDWWTDLFSKANAIPWVREFKKTRDGETGTWHGGLDYIFSDNGLIKTIEKAAPLAIEAFK